MFYCGSGKREGCWEQTRGALCFVLSRLRTSESGVLWQAAATVSQELMKKRQIATLATVATATMAFGARRDVSLDFLPLLLRTAACRQASEPLHKFPAAETVGPISAEKFVPVFQQH